MLEPAAQPIRVAVQWLGRIPYAQAWQLQRDLASQIAGGLRPPTLLLLEHPHTYTLGRRALREHILWDPETLAQRGIEVFEVDRGGDVTYHGPGQLVGYPLLPLAPRGWQGERLPQVDFVGFVRKLEQAIILALAAFGIVSAQRPGFTGVWVAADVWSRCPRCIPGIKPQPAKIASIGVKVDARGISQHGFALNVDTDAAYWEGIVPCGLQDVSICSVADFVPVPPALPRVAERVAQSFAEVFNYEFDGLE